MLETLLKLYYSAYLKYQSLTLELSHDKGADWDLVITHRDSHTVIFSMNSCFLTDLAVQGYTALKEWLDQKNYDGAQEFLVEAEIF